jgi:uncharacterized protein (TIGR02453 family)
MGKAYFTPEIFSFLKQIKRNNRRPWFLKNRERYEEVAHRPGLRFVVDFGFRLKEISPWILVDSKPHHGSLQRIYRDVRFSPDKRPYKTWVGMTFPHASRTEEVRAAGYYMHLGPEGTFLYGGTWQPDRRSLAKIRDAIAWKPEEWKKAKRGLTLEGSRLTRAPRGYPETHPMIEDLKWVDFVASVKFSPQQVCGPSFLRDAATAARKLAPLLQFLSRAQGLEF